MTLLVLLAVSLLGATPFGAEAAARRAVEGRAHGVSLRSTINDTRDGAVVVAFTAEVSGVPVLAERLTVVLNRRHEVVAVFGALTEGPLRGTFGKPPPRARAVAWPKGGKLHAAWYVEGERHAVVTSATDGEVLQTIPLEWPATYRVWADATTRQPDDGPQGTAASPYPHPAPQLYEPAFTAPQRVTVEPDAWLPAGATATTGNNVDAYADLMAPDGFGAGDVRADPTSAATFDRSYDPAAAPGSSMQQIKASVAQAFYTLNFLHDWYYAAGFDEAAGNAQASNGGKGGKEGDPLLAEVQDSDSTSNAFMRVPADGASPRLRVGVYDAVDRSVVTAGTKAYVAGQAQFGPQSFDVTAQLVAVTDGVAPANDGCSALTNAAQVAGKIALVPRGLCTFVEKARFAQDAGAVGVIVYNNTSGLLAVPGTDAMLTLPTLGLSQADGQQLLATAGTAMVRLERSPRVDRDGALDSIVLAHEFTHLVSHRLVGDGAGLFHPTGLALGEGWSDFGALLFTVRAADAMAATNTGWSGAFAFGGYARSGLIPDSYYYGSRRLPYSNDLAKNALTFKHLMLGEPLPAMPAPRFGADGSLNNVQHQAGEVWASMLWDCFVALLKDPRYTFDTALERMKRYFVASLAATPAVPTFLEARDALLAVVYATEPRDHALFVAAFARRGMGPRAAGPAPTSTDFRGITEDFMTGAAVRIEVPFPGDNLVSCDGDGQLDPGEAARLTVKVVNTGETAITSLKVTVAPVSMNVRVLELQPVTVAGSLAPLAEASVSVSVVVDASFMGTELDLLVTAAGSGLTGLGTAVKYRVGYRPNAGTRDDVEVEPSPWVATGWRRVSEGQGHHFNASSPLKAGELTLVSPPLMVRAGMPFTVRFQHRHAFDGAYEGGVLELSENDGQTFNDVGAAAMPGYVAMVSGPGNPLLGRQAFTGTSMGWPAWVPVTADLGTAYGGKTVRLRLRFGSSNEGVSFGWDVDDLEVSGIDGRPFNALQAQTTACTARPPVAVVGPDQSARGGDTVTLDGSKSFDLDSQPLTFRWEQLEGPSATLTGGDKAAFTAPGEGGVLRFRLVVSDGMLDSAPVITTVTVEPGDTPIDPPQGCGCGAGPGGALVLLLLLLRDPVVLNRPRTRR